MSAATAAALSGRAAPSSAAGKLHDASSPPPFLARGVWHRWPKQPQPVLAGVDLRVEAGTTVAVTGANGAGKTTLLRIAAGLIAPARGEVTSLGLDPERDRRRYQSLVGFLSPGDRGLYARLTVRQQLEFWVRLALVPRADRAATMDAALERFSLAPLADRRVDRLSMGQRQRVRLALAFLHGPRLALLDEPATSLDDDGLELLASAARELTARGGAVIWCSPFVGAADPIRFDRRYVLRDGRLVDG